MPRIDLQMSISLLATPDFVRRVERLATGSAPGQVSELGGVHVQYVVDESRRQLELRELMQLVYHNGRVQAFGVLGACRAELCLLWVLWAFWAMGSLGSLGSLDSLGSLGFLCFLGYGLFGLGALGNFAWEVVPCEPACNGNTE